MLVKADITCSVDASLKSKDQFNAIAGIGGIVWNKEGNKHYFFSGLVCAADIVEVEVLAIEFLINVLSVYVFRDKRINIYSDSLLAIEKVNGKLTQGFWNFMYISLYHIPRKYNVEAGSLAK